MLAHFFENNNFFFTSSYCARRFFSLVVVVSLLLSFTTFSVFSLFQWIRSSWHFSHKFATVWYWTSLNGTRAGLEERDRFFAIRTESRLFCDFEILSRICSSSLLLFYICIRTFTPVNFRFIYCDLRYDCCWASVRDIQRILFENVLVRVSIVYLFLFAICFVRDIRYLCCFNVLLSWTSIWNVLGVQN